MPAWQNALYLKKTAIVTTPLGKITLPAGSITSPSVTEIDISGFKPYSGAQLYSALIVLGNYQLPYIAANGTVGTEVYTISSATIKIGNRTTTWTNYDAYATLFYYTP